MEPVAEDRGADFAVASHWLAPGQLELYQVEEEARP